MELKILNFRIEKDITSTAVVKTNEQLVNLANRDIRLVMTTPNLQTIDVGFVIVDEHKIRFTVRGEVCGLHTFTLYEGQNSDTRATAVDLDFGFNFVSDTHQEGGDAIEGLDTESVDLGVVNLAVGVRGESAYEIAVRRGFVGSEEQFLEALRGPIGYSGNINYPTFDTTDDGDVYMTTDAASDADRFEVIDDCDLFLII